MAKLRKIKSVYQGTYIKKLIYDISRRLINSRYQVVNLGNEKTEK